MQALLLHLPLLGPALRLGALARNLSALAALLRSGVPLPESLRVAAAAGGAEALAGIFHELALELESGLPLSTAMGRWGWDGLDLCSEAALIGEESGALAEQMEWAAAELEARSTARISTLMSLLEPALVVLLALVVGLVAAALFLPVLSLAGRVAG